jgi:hypothetical protein
MSSITKPIILSEENGKESCMQKLRSERKFSRTFKRWFWPAMLNFWLGFGRGRCIGRNLKRGTKEYKQKTAFSSLDLSLAPCFNLKWVPFYKEACLVKLTRDT